MLNKTLLLVLLSLPSVAVAQPQTAPQSPEAIIVTVGEGVVKRVPDRAWIGIAAESRAKTPREAQKANADAMNAVMQKLKSFGLAADAIQTTTYELQPEFDYANNRQTLRGYVARNAVEVRVDDLPRVGEILEAAVGSGATTVRGVRFDLKDREGAEREALRIAVKDARARADALADGAGVSVRRVVRIEEQRMSEPRPMMRTMAAQEMMAGQPPIAPGELEIPVTVMLTVAIR